MISIEEAASVIASNLYRVVLPLHRVPIHESFGTILASDVKSLLDCPPFDKAAMDGFAVPETDSTDYRILETVQAGDMPSLPLVAGTCTRIMTGAPVPEGTHRVIPVEITAVNNDTMTVTSPSPARHVMKRGEDIRSGDTIAARGTRVDAITLAVLISGGIETVEVMRKPEVTVFSTGDELVQSMHEWVPGKIFDSNGPMMTNMLRSAGVDIVRSGHLADDMDNTMAGIELAKKDSDILVFSGGVSAGDFDFIPEALTRCGFTIHFDKVCVKPGKPMTFATCDRHLAFGFPGNPVSTTIMLYLLLVPALNAMQGRIILPRTISMPITESWRRRKTERVEFVPAVITNDGIHPLPYHGSGHLASLMHADGFMRIEAGISSINSGELVSFWPLKLDGFGESPSRDHFQGNA